MSRVGDMLIGIEEAVGAYLQDHPDAVSVYDTRPAFYVVTDDMEAYVRTMEPYATKRDIQNVIEHMAELV